MFPLSLRYYLETKYENCSVEAIKAILPEIQWGDEVDLLKHSDEWPEAVVILERRESFSYSESHYYPVEINFVHFPGRAVGNVEPLLPIKLHILRKLAMTFECRAICESDDFCRTGDILPGCSISETFLCQGGRIFAGNLAAYDASDGAKPRRGWIPLDEIPDTEEALCKWIELRDQSHINDEELPIYPDPPQPKEEKEYSQEEIDAEIAEEFPSEEELEQEEWEMEEHFRRLEAWERGVETTASKQLIQAGISLPPPDSFETKKALYEKLWEVINGLSECNTYLSRTDHLSDQQLYAYLWKEGLNEGAMDLSGLSGCSMHHDILGSGDDESCRISLTYYDDAEYRADWLAKFPGEPIPAHMELPFDRDRLLPRPDY